eukprot:s4315_g4.t1
MFRALMQKLANVVANAATQVQTPHRTASEEVQRSSKISASLLLATSILVVFGVYIYQRTFARLDEYEEQTLERLKTTDRTLKQTPFCTTSV